MKLSDMRAFDARNYVRKLFTYDLKTGDLRWAVSRQGRYATPGNDAGSIEDRGHISVRLDGHKYSAARIIHLMLNGTWPKTRCIYRDGNPGNLRWNNLSFDPDEQPLTQAARYMRDLRELNKEIDRRIAGTPAMRAAYYAADQLEARRMRAEVRREIRDERAQAFGGNHKDVQLRRR